MIVAMQTTKIHPDAILPIPNTGGAACFQFAALVEDADGVYIGPGGKYVFRTGLKLTIPNSWVIEVYPRRAQDLTILNHHGSRVGLLDINFQDEVTIELVNEGKSIVQIKHGDIIADGLLTQAHGARFIDVALANTANAPAAPGEPAFTNEA